MDANGRQYVKYDFFKIRPSWFWQEGNDRGQAKTQFVEDAAKLPGTVMTRAYSLVGLRADADLLMWYVAESLEGLQTAAVRLRSTTLVGKYMDQTYSYLAMTRKSEYVSDHRHPDQEGDRTKVTATGSKYLIVYPFVKTREWYLLPQEERQRMMSEHFRVGHKYPSVHIHTSYSFGLDDHEFMLGFETDHPGEFLDLVAELRTIEGSRYTKLDTPIFTCVAGSVERAVESLVGDEGAHETAVAVDESIRHLTDHLSPSFEARPVEDSVSHPAEGLLEEFLEKHCRNRQAMDKLVDFCADSSRPEFTVSALKCLARIEGFGYNRWQTSLVAKCLAMPDVEVRGAAVQLAVFWGDYRLKELLESHVEPVPWLKGRIRKVMEEMPN